jgi:hypothetical protein
MIYNVTIHAKLPVAGLLFPLFSEGILSEGL